MSFQIRGLQALRPGDPKAVAVLCADAIKTNGRKVLLHLAVGDNESAVWNCPPAEDVRMSWGVR